MTHHSPIHAALPATIDDLPEAALGETAAPERWTPDKQAAFLRELAAVHSVAAAARSVGMSRQSAYRLRARLRGQPFDRAWAMALGSAFDALAQAALERALFGVEVPHYHKGELVGTSRRYDERLTIALLAKRAALTQVPEVPSHAVPPRDLGHAIERVEFGPDTWVDETRRQLRLR